MSFSFSIISSVAARPRHSDLKQEEDGCGSGHSLRLRKPPDNKRVLKANNLSHQQGIPPANWRKENA